MKLGLFPLLGALSALSASACSPELTCNEEFSGGGDVVGTTAGRDKTMWIVVEPCEDIVSAPPRAVNFEQQPPPTAGEAPPEEANGDWCQNLSFAADGGLANVNTWFPRLPLRKHSPLLAGQPTWYDAYVVYTATGTFSFGAVTFGRQKLEMPSKCLTQQGVSITCDQLGTELAALWEVEGGLQNMECHPQAGAAGCECFYDLNIYTGQAGTFATTGDLITHYDQSSGPPFLVDFQVQGSSLNMSGYQRRPVFGINGIRTLKFARVICDDGVAGPGEEGVDCGNNCAMPCP
jgi:hypothetical protein